MDIIDIFVDKVVDQNDTYDRRVSKKGLIDLLQRAHSDSFGEYDPPVEAIINDLIKMGIIDKQILSD